MTNHPGKESPDKIDIIPLQYCVSSEAIFRSVCHRNQPVWLDSGKPASLSGRFDIISSDPDAFFECQFSEDPNVFLLKLRNYIADKKQRASIPLPLNIDIPFLGGLIGYFDYEFNHKLFGLNKHKKGDTATTSAVGYYSWAFIQDHKLKKSYGVFHPRWEKRKRQELLDLIEGAVARTISVSPKLTSTTHWTSTQKKPQYTENIQKIKDYITQGDIYQANYSQLFSTRSIHNAFDIYNTLRQAVPSPYCAFLSFKHRSILSISPEQFISVHKRGSTYTAITKPIKGTKKRSRNLKQDDQLAHELLNSEKDRAENLMIVDLLRNDFSKNCAPGTVKTPHLFALETYANVHHLVSTVTGQLKPNISPLQFMLECFPGGSITGAPKRRAMEIIDELEPHSRDTYCGSIFFQCINGELNSNIAIRTMLYDTDKNEIVCCGGGGIVADSKDESEYEESLQKINMLMESISQP